MSTLPIPSDYIDLPEDYNWLTQEQQKTICDKYTMVYTSYVKARRGNNEVDKLYFGAQLLGMQTIFKALNIYVAYGWEGHRNETILVTREVKEMHDDWIFQCSDF